MKDYRRTAWFMHADIHRLRGLAGQGFISDCCWCTDYDEGYMMGEGFEPLAPEPALVRVTWRTHRSESATDWLLREQYSRDVNIDAAPRGVEIPIVTAYGTIESITVGRVPR